MKIRYHDFDGKGFQGPDDLFPPPGLIRVILQFGEDALEALDDGDEQIRELIEQMIAAGLLERDEDGNLRLTPRMVKGIEQFEFHEIFRQMRQGHKGGHAALDPVGRSSERLEGTKPYEFGDPLSEIDVPTTLRNALARRTRQSATTATADGLMPLGLRTEDVEVHRTESTGDASIVVLIDLSGSMMRYGRFIQAKRVALGLKGLVERRFPQDTLHFVGFSSVAERIAEKDLPLVMPKPITVRDWQVRMRLPLEQAHEGPPHFTNLQHGLRMARSILARQGGANRQIFIITDGQPTAHVETNEAGGEMLYLLYPPERRTAEITLAEALRCARQGIRINSFALVDDYEGMGWIGFIERMTRLVKGVAYYCTAGDLPGMIMESYLSGKKTKRTAGPGGA